MVYFETILGSKRVFHLREVEEGHFLPYFANWKKTQTRWCHLTGKMHISFSLLSRPCSRLSYQRTFAASHQPGGKSSFSATVHKSQMTWKDKKPFKRRNFVTDEKVFTVHWGPRSCKGRKHYLFLKMLGAKLCNCAWTQVWMIPLVWFDKRGRFFQKPEDISALGAVCI